MGGDDRLLVQVLGPIRAVDAEGRDVTPDGPLQRRLLALLVLRRGRVVPAEVAIDVLWPTRPPRDPTPALHNHVFRLRRGLPDGVVESLASGYRIDASRVELDADRLADAVNGGEDPAALATIGDVLARWQGPAYPELDDVDDGRAEAVRLEELRIRAHEVRAERRLATGDTDGLVAEIAALADREPLRERPRALLMAALAGAGRTVEALRVYDDFRRLLGDELGIEPSPALAAQHAELLVGAGTSPVTASRLPVPATSLVGREALVHELVTTVGAARLVTLVGPGGVGKTRLLVEIGHRLRAARPDRPVVLCELASATEQTAVDAVAKALAIDARPGVDLVERVATVLGDDEVVVLLDNCEHVLDAVAALVDRLLSSCPNLTVAAASQERLRVPGERLRRVPPLPVGPEDTPAVELFVERARAVAPGFEPDARERAVIAEIVRRLDGLPLAIELAAARLHTHDVSDVAAGLDRRFAILSSGNRASSRHGSLTAAVSWSYDLLDPPLQQTFADLSVFAGPFTIGDAAAICGVDAETADAALQQLVERSLVARAPDRRYVLLETLRAFGTEQLAASGRLGLAAERHAHHQVDWIECAARRLLDDGQPVLGEIDAAIPELRAAVGWLLAHHEVELAGRLVSVLLDYGFMRLRPDVLAWSEQVIAADPDDRSPHAALMWTLGGYASWMAGDLAEMRRRSDRAVQVSERRGEVPGRVLMLAANCELFDGNLPQAVVGYRRANEASAGDPGQHLIIAGTEALALAYAGDPAATTVAGRLLDEVGGSCTAHSAYVWYCAGEADLVTDAERASERFTRALELAERTHASVVTGIAGASKASIDARLGDPLVAAAEYRRLIDHWRRAGMWSTQWTMLRAIAGLLERLGRPYDAAVLEGAVRATAAGHRIFGADEVALNELGARLRAALGDDEYEAALRDGAALDGDAAAERALRAL
jgi:predicted ATPase/DNA-binding SARP family transcriptional activator